ncbi:MAG: riboflavin kinase, partial [Nanoarchaeota archaeon]|nr:riboflavin kinase [Nanoarchaeota archaeon]
DFYAKTLALEFVKRLRDERKFGSVEELKAQIERDVLSARSTKLL